MPAPKLFTTLPDASNFRMGATVDPTQSCAAAPLEDPDAGAVAIDRDPGGGSDLPALRQLEVVLDGLYRDLLGGDDLGQRDHGRGNCYRQANRRISTWRPSS